MNRRIARFFSFCLALCIACAPVVSFAHSGRTDASGGHYNRSTGEYHYHHGKPAHQHPNGVCPYDRKATPKPTLKPTPKPTRKPTTPTPKATFSHIPHVVTVYKTNIYEGPSIGDTILKKVYEGDILYVLAYRMVNNVKWYKVETQDGTRGYIKADWVEKYSPSILQLP